MADGETIRLSVPGNKEYALVIRTALGGAAILKDLDVDTMDDLRMAADESCDCLLHQGVPVKELHVTIGEDGAYLQVSIEAEMQGDGHGDADDAAVMQAVLETLAPKVHLTTTAGGCIRRIDLAVLRVGM